MISSPFLLLGGSRSPPRLASQNISEICAESIDNATFVCAEHYALFKAPRIELVCDTDLHFPYVPGHL